MPRAKLTTAQMVALRARGDTYPQIAAAAGVGARSVMRRVDPDTRLDHLDQKRQSYARRRAKSGVEVRPKRCSVCHELGHNAGRHRPLPVVDIGGT